MLRTAKEIVASGDTKRVVDFAVETDRAIKSASKELEVAKEFLRETATEIVAHTFEENATINGNIGSATVVFPKPKVEPQKGVNLLAIEGSMSPELFNMFFRKETVVVIATDFIEKYDQLAPAQQVVLSAIIKIESQTPRVTVK